MLCTVLPARSGHIRGPSRSIGIPAEPIPRPVDISFVVPVFNEKEVLPHFLGRMGAVANGVSARRSATSAAVSSRHRLVSPAMRCL